mgnify:CR=1 FL=1
MKLTTKQLLQFYGWSENPDIDECAKKAYLDVARTMKYRKASTDLTDLAQEKDNYLQGITKLIREKIERLFLENEVNEEDFQRWHECTCEMIVDDSKSCEVIEKFHYGHAQKWLNMTLKNMMIVGVEVVNAKHSLEDLASFFHVPIDTLIMRVISREYKIKLPLGKDPSLYDEYYGPLTRGENKGKYVYNPGNKFLSWSNWDKEQYIQVQGELQEKIKDENKSPLEWEFAAWIRARDD